MLLSILTAPPFVQPTLRRSLGLAMADRKSAIVVLEAADHEMVAVASLHAECFEQPWSEEEMVRLSRRPGTSIALARSEGKGRDRPLGFLILSQVADEAEILSIGVSTKGRRKGVGDALVRSAIRKAQASRAKSVFLEVDENNAAAVALYDRTGFVQVGERLGYYRRQEEEPSRALVMRLDLR